MPLNLDAGKLIIAVDELRRRAPFDRVTRLVMGTMSPVVAADIKRLISSPHPERGVGLNLDLVGSAIEVEVIDIARPSWACRVEKIRLTGTCSVFGPGAVHIQENLRGIGGVGGEDPSEVRVLVGGHHQGHGCSGKFLGSFALPGPGAGSRNRRCVPRPMIGGGAKAKMLAVDMAASLPWALPTIASSCRSGRFRSSQGFRMTMPKPTLSASPLSRLNPLTPRTSFDPVDRFDIIGDLVHNTRSVRAREAASGSWMFMKK